MPLSFVIVILLHIIQRIFLLLPSTENIENTTKQFAFNFSQILLRLLKKAFLSKIKGRECIQDYLQAPFTPIFF